MKKYDKYKNSGIEWIGDIPEHWEITKMKFLSNTIIDGTHFTPTYISKGIPFLRVTDLQNIEIDLSKTKYISLEEHKSLTKRCKPEKGDVLLSKNGTIGITKVVDWDYEFSVFVSICLIKLKPILTPSFFVYLFGSHVVDLQIKAKSKTTSVTNLHLDQIRELISIVPPIEDQKRINNFLDEKTGEIDEAIALKNQLIALLQEEKSALINEAVTKGIDPTVPMKESGIEWIGDIPAHWEIVNIQDVTKKNRYSFTGGPFGSDLKSEEYTKSGVRIIQLQNIGIGEFLDDYAIYTTEKKADELYSCNIFPNDIIIAKMADPVARACMMPSNDSRYLMASDGIRLEVNTNKYNSIFLVYAINSLYFNSQAEQVSTGTTRLRIGLSTLKKLKLLSPNIDEQIQIAQYIDKKTQEIDQEIDYTKEEIALLKEYRQSLISEAVTGKIDVRK